MDPFEFVGIAVVAVSVTSIAVCFWIVFNAYAREQDRYEQYLQQEE